MGVVVEYANRNGKPQWHTPGKSDWNYLRFGASTPVTPPDEVIPMEIGKRNGGKGGFNVWTIHADPFERSQPITKIHGKATAGIFKDTVLIEGSSRVEVDFVADNPGLTLFHCHQNLHMDFGLMRLFEYA